MGEIGVEVRGLLETQRKMEQVVSDLRGKPMLEAMRDASLLVSNDAKRFAPVDTGRLRASITPEVRIAGAEILGVVGSNVKYAPYMELGTRPHFPPVSALQTWARRHGTNAWAVARAIAARGTAPRRFFQRAIENNEGRIIDKVEHAINKIVRK